MLAAPHDPRTAKKLGAYYTSPTVAQFLVNWAIRSKEDRVLDPSAGGGVFLEAAHERILQLGGEPSQCIYGIELDGTTHAATSAALAALGVPSANLLQADFFAASLESKYRFDALVGNPPFIRYQEFTGAARRHAALLLQRQGVRISELASSWAPFVVAGAALLPERGRLALVVPMELCHAGYALPVLEFLGRSFRTVHFLSFAERLFPDLNQETILLLADDKGSHSAQFRWRHFRDADALDEVSATVHGARRLNAESMVTGRQRLIEQFMSARARRLYAELRSHELVRPLGSVADVGIGYVTGANDFFHLSGDDGKRLGIPPEYLQPAVCRGRALAGLRFTPEDWHAAHATGSAAYLLSLPRSASLPAPVRRYVRAGETAAVHRTYKCRMRSPWYHVPHVYRADAFLTYMSGHGPRLVANDAGAVAPNTLHLVRMLPLAETTVAALAVSWCSSLTELSAEVEGHALGGGMLKLEPTEAGRVLVALAAREKNREQCEVLDVLARHAAPPTARAAVDQLILGDRLGLSDKDCHCLHEAAHVLRARRLGSG